MRYSIQQIKYEFLYAIKEFDSKGSLWNVVTSDLPPSETLIRLGLEPEDYVFVGKPAGTARAADLVADFFKGRFEVVETPTRADVPAQADWVILYRTKASLPSAANPLTAEA